MRLVFGLLRKCALPPSSSSSTASSASQTLRTRGRALFDNLFGKYLLWTNTVSCGVLMAAGDAVAQKIEAHHAPPEKRTAFDWHRTGVMFVVGFTQGPVQHVFYGWLDNRFTAVNGRNVAKKIALDQSIMSPVAIVQFFIMAGLMEGQTLEESLRELRSKFLTVFLSDCMFWPIAQYINFSFTPAPYRVLYINMLTMLYNVWLSIVKHNDDLTNVLVALPAPATTTSTTAPNDNANAQQLPGGKDL